MNAGPFGRGEKKPNRTKKESEKKKKKEKKKAGKNVKKGKTLTDALDGALRVDALDVPRGVVPDEDAVDAVLAALAAALVFFFFWRIYSFNIFSFC